MSKTLREQLERRTRERDEARRFGEEAAAKYNQLINSTVLRCAFCEMEFPRGTPPSQHEALTAHVMECPAHPMKVRDNLAESLNNMPCVVAEHEELEHRLKLAEDTLVKIAHWAGSKTGTPDGYTSGLHKAKAVVRGLLEEK